MNKSAPTMDEVWHTLPLGMPRCHTGTHRHRVVFDCVALYNVLCRDAPPLRWRETAVVFILCWHTLPLYWKLCLAGIANESCDSCRAGATTSPLIIILCSQHTAFLLFCVGTHCQRVMRLMPCGGYDKSSYYYFVFSTHRFLLFCVGTHCQRVMRLMPCGGYDKSSYYYFVFSTHRFFIILCWHALPTSHATHAVRGLRQVLLLLFCVLNTLLFIICVGTLCQRVMRLMPCGGYDKSSYYYLCLQHTAFLLFPTLIIILCLQHTAFLLFPPFLVRNVIVRGSRYSCCLGYRLLFPYMILFKLYIY